LNNQNPDTSSDKLAGILEVAKNLSGLPSSLAALGESKVHVLPMNPRISNHLWWVAAILAALAGFGAHKFAKQKGRLVLGWISLALAIVALLAILVLSREPSWLSPETASLAAHFAYVLFFVFVGGTFGGFLT